ncbi:tetratricopeptide repeat protein [Hahella ganghwensis]|uniref:tetratricopeptide repeat protein n=1 Tax=Hahella ganghwensis TaxID=286420 RepID=UPI00036303D1|nr:hypothetical protein [Hahella ganghwensis]
MSPDDAPQGGKIQNGRKNTLNIRPYIVESLNYLRTLGLFRLSLAGVLFEIGKFTFASKFYRKAIDIDDRKETLALYADSLMFSGRYQEAHDVFEKYVTETGSQNAEWRLKLVYLSSVIENQDIKFQHRNIKKAFELAIVTNLDTTEAEESLEKALKQDLLCGLAWFNLAHLKNSSGNTEEAAFCYTMCALVNKGDVEAWVNATAYSFNKSVPSQIFILLVRAGYFCNGDRYIEALYQAIEFSLGSEALSQIAHIIEQVLSEDTKPKDCIPELRIVNEEGVFENVLIKE